MAYTNRPGDEYANRPGGEYTEPAVTGPVVEYHDRVRWGPIFGGLVTAISLQLVLSALGAAVGLSSLSDAGVSAGEAKGVGIGVGIWSIISILISLFVGGYATARACGPMSKTSAILNGAILWCTTIVVSTWLLSSGVSGAFGVVLSNAGSVASQVAPQGNLPSVPSPNVDQSQITGAAGNVASASWWFALGCLLSLIAAILGATVGTRSARVRT